MQLHLKTKLRTKHLESNFAQIENIKIQPLELVIKISCGVLDLKFTILTEF